MKVELVVSGLMFGGGQRIVVDLVRQGAKHNMDLHVILLGKIVSQFDQLNMVSVEYDGRYNRLGTLLPTAQRLRNVLKRDQPDALHTHGWDADLIGYAARLGSDIRQIVHLHVTPAWVSSRKIKHVVRRAVTRRVLSSSKVRVIAVSNAVRVHWSKFLGLSPSTISVVHNGVDVNNYKPVRSLAGVNDVPAVGVAARLVPMKGIEYLIRALKDLKEENVPFQLKVAGVGKSRESLAVVAKEAGIDGETNFVGQVDNMCEFYQSVDVFALPSVLPEGLPLTILEAMASGIPVVGTTVAGAPEAVRDGVDGYLVPPRDVSGLADALRLLLEDPKLRRSLGRNARQRAVESFSLDRFAREIFALYQ